MVKERMDRAPRDAAQDTRLNREGLGVSSWVDRPTLR